ncbi:MAG TPA: TIGR01244 family sulfur transferase [Caulobacteraceae bacterium]|nr:TIGR01244 family sulfur transferase [Caulobacteraceae bacterium]
MNDFRQVTESFAVSRQIAPADVARAVAQGFTLIINNRPDGEAPGQPTGDQIADVARAAGLAYVHIPVVGRPTPAQIDAMRAAVGGSGGKVLAFCRSGTRSINTWALGAPVDRDEILRLGATAGYDLSGVV